MKILNLLLFTTLNLLISTLNAQINDYFSDTNVLPAHWVGDRGSFIINSNGVLQLAASGSGSSYLSTPITQHYGEMEWSYSIKMSFAPSVNNYTRLWLMADRENLLDENIRGYFLQLGENGSQDAIELRYIENKNENLICRGKDGVIANSFHLIIKTIKEDDRWSIYFDERRIGFFELDATASHTNQNQPFMGLSCHYTSSNSTKFFFDHIYYGTPIADTIPTQIEHIYTPPDMKSIQITFSKSISPEQILHNENFRIIENNLHPAECRFSNDTYNEIIILFFDPFPEEIPFHLEISGLRDINNQIIEKVTIEVFFTKIRRNDIVIHEIMAAPRPVVGLPDAEYIEIYNRKESNITLKNWELQIGKTIRKLPDITLNAQSYALIVSEANKPFFNDLTNCYSVTSFSITDAGQEIILYNEMQEVIHYVKFKSSWHWEAIKRNGGWALEMIDPDNSCQGASNWGSSIAQTGGTPGIVNSIYKTNPDINHPEIERISLKDSLSAKLFFSEQIQFEIEELLGNISIDHTIEVSHIEEVPPDFRSILIHFGSPIEKGKIYTLSINSGMEDCSGISLPINSRISFGLPSPVENKDLIINEILTSSGDHGNYIEIYNHSSKIIDMQEVLLGSGGDTIPQKAVSAVSGGYQLLPANYVVICENKEITVAQYYTPYPERLITHDSFPNYAKSGGVIFLTDKSLQTIDKLKYDEKMHYSMLSSSGGVSLERIHFSAATENRDSWKSAAASSGYGTPGYLNSQFIQPSERDDMIEVIPEIISPDNDGFNDYTTIRCHFNDPENRVSITIYDPRGNPVKLLIDNQYCGTEALFTWDGTTRQENIAPPGLYIILIEYWNGNGESKKEKRVVGVR